jgi:hypothetical protein
MSTTNDTGVRTFKCAADLEPFRGVKFDGSGNLVYAGLTDRPIGFTIDRGFNGEHVSVALASVAGSVQVSLSGNVTTYGGSVFQLANGQFSGTNPGTAIAAGRALTIASSGATIEMMPTNAV